MPLEAVSVAVDESEPIPESVLALSAAAERALDGAYADGLLDRRPAFAPSDVVAVFRVLRELARDGRDGERFCEWGSSVGGVVGAAHLAGFRASGIEIDAALVDASRAVLEDHAPGVEIVEGSFVPAEFEPSPDAEEVDSYTVSPGEAAYDDLGRDLDEFSVVFSYPWPGAEPLHFEIFDSHAAEGALLVTWHGADGVAVHRRV